MVVVRVVGIETRENLARRVQDDGMSHRQHSIFKAARGEPANSLFDGESMAVAVARFSAHREVPPR